MLTLNKQQRIKNELRIAEIFKNGNSIIAYPLRICYLLIPKTQSRIMVSVPKKNFKRAVKRNMLKRRIREAYRLNQESLVLPEGTSAEIAFRYIAAEEQSFDKVQKAVCKGLNKIMIDAQGRSVPICDE